MSGNPSSSFLGNDFHLPPFLAHCITEALDGFENVTNTLAEPAEPYRKFTMNRPNLSKAAFGSRAVHSRAVKLHRRAAR